MNSGHAVVFLIFLYLGISFKYNSVFCSQVRNTISSRLRGQGRQVNYFEPKYDFEDYGLPFEEEKNNVKKEKAEKKKPLKLSQKPKKKTKFDDSENKGQQRRVQEYPFLIDRSKYDALVARFPLKKMAKNGSKYICPMRSCGVETLTPHRHLLTHYKEKFTKCLVCDDEFKAIENVSRHLRKHSENEINGAIARLGVVDGSAVGNSSEDSYSNSESISEDMSSVEQKIECCSGSLSTSSTDDEISKNSEIISLEPILPSRTALTAADRPLPPIIAKYNDSIHPSAVHSNPISTDYCETFHFNSEISTDYCETFHFNSENDYFNLHLIYDLNDDFFYTRKRCRSSASDVEFDIDLFNMSPTKKTKIDESENDFFTEANRNYLFDENLWNS